MNTTTARPHFRTGPIVIITLLAVIPAACASHEESKPVAAAEPVQTTAEAPVVIPVAAHEVTATVAHVSPPVELPRSEDKESHRRSVIKSIPADVRKDLYTRLDEYSSQVDGLEKREMAADELTDATARSAAYEKLSKEYADCREGISGIMNDPKYSKYKSDPGYGPEWQGYEGRFNYWSAKLKSINKKLDRARAAAKESKKEPASNK